MKEVRVGLGEESLMLVWGLPGSTQQGRCEVMQTMSIVGWVVSHPTWNSYIQVLTPDPIGQIVTVFGDEVIQKVVQLKWGH